MFDIDSFAYRNKLTNVHPVEKIIFALTTLMICLLSKNPAIYLIVIALMAYLTVFKAHVPGKFYFKLLLIPSSFLLLGILSIAIIDITPHATSLIKVKIFNQFYGITLTSLFYSLKVFLKSLSSVSCLYFISLTTPIIDVVSVLRRIKVPEIFLELMTLIYRLILILFEVIGNIYTSQSSRLGYTSLKNKYRSLGYLVSSLFTLSYKKTGYLFTALEARGYTGKLNVLEKNYKFCAKNIIYIAFSEILLVYLGIISS